VVTGHGAFVVPFFRQVRFLTLAMRESEVAEQCVTNQGISLQARAVIAFKLGAGHIDAMAAPHNAAIQRQAKIAQAQANQAAAEAEQASQRKQADYARQTAIVQAQCPGGRGRPGQREYQRAERCGGSRTAGRKPGRQGLTIFDSIKGNLSAGEEWDEAEEPVVDQTDGADPKTAGGPAVRP
jgi:hypothetical protein